MRLYDYGLRIADGLAIEIFQSKIQFPLLINVSNHPSVQWTGDQWSAACDRFGTVYDIAHPDIDPGASTETIQEMTGDVVQRIRQMDPDAVHVMGEQTFCFALIVQLQQAGYRCMASTTERRVTEQDDGRRTYQFQFVQFRDYPQFTDVIPSSGL